MMDLELSFQDDNTSCSSSLSATVSEDVDDLHLGAEANMLSPKYDDSEANSRRKPVQNFMIVKESSTSEGTDDLDFTFSTISSIPDLIDARVGDPEDLLYRLGFAPLEGEESHSSILSRFNSQSDCGGGGGLVHDQQQIQNATTAQIGVNAHEGIMKTQEWLNNQDDLHNSSQSVSTVKDGAGSGKISNTTSQSQGKRLPAQKKRLRWSKSRQSSFEHLLPNLEEEESVPTAHQVEASDESEKDCKSIGPIRESSQEKDEVPDVRQEVLSQQPRGSAFPAKTKAVTLLEVEGIVTDCERDCSCPQYPASAKMAIKSSPSPISSTTPVNFVEMSDEGFQALPARLSPWKRANLVTMKVDSFELEEIVSNDGHLSPNFLRSIKQAAGSAASNRAVIGHDAAERDLNEHNALLDRSSPSLASSDSSSGFDEGVEDLSLSTQRRDSVGSIEDSCDERLLDECLSIPTVQIYAKKLSESLCSMAYSAPMHQPCEFWQKLNKFCTLRSKIACASGIAEYALLQSNQKRRPREVGNCNCSSPLTVRHHDDCSPSSDMKSSCALDRSSRDQTPISSTVSAGKMLGCLAYSDRPKTKCQKWKKRSLHSVSDSDFSRNNVNNSNSSTRGGLCNRLPPLDRRLYRISSMPTLTSKTALLPCRKISCESYFAKGIKNKTENKCVSSLMSSISDVTYLSFRSSSNCGNLQACSVGTMRSESLPLQNCATASNTIVCKEGEARSTASECNGCVCSFLPIGHQTSIHNGIGVPNCQSCKVGDAWTMKLMQKRASSNLSQS